MPTHVFVSQIKERQTKILEEKARPYLAVAGPPERRLAEAIRVIDSLQLTEHHLVATPGNWKQGEDVVIVPSLPLLPLSVKVGLVSPSPQRHQDRGLYEVKSVGIVPPIVKAFALWSVSKIATSSIEPLKRLKLFHLAPILPLAFAKVPLLPFVLELSKTPSIYRLPVPPLIVATT